MPHVIVFAGDNAFIDGVVRKVEERWPRAAKYRPRWIEPTVLHIDLFPFLGKDRERRRRFFGVTTASSTAVNARFVMHYNETFDDKSTRAFSPNSAYDAFYLVAYALYAQGDGAVTGESLSRAIARLVPSQGAHRTIDVGIAGIFDAYNALRRGENIDLNGATGPLDFDLATGESVFDQDVVCVGTDDRGLANDSIESGLVFDAREKKLRGAMKCP
jgi:branched-chain amino acid transport system substrate-binding protein